MSAQSNSAENLNFFAQAKKPLLSITDRSQEEDKEAPQEYMVAITSPEDETQKELDQLKARLKKLKTHHGIFSTAGAFGVFPVIILTATFSSKLAESIKIDSLPNFEDTIIQMSLFALYGLTIYVINHNHFEKKINECSAEITVLEAKLRAMEMEKQISTRLDAEIKPVINDLGKRILFLESSTRILDKSVPEDKTLQKGASSIELTPPESYTYTR